MSKVLNVFCVIVTYNGGKWIASCLESLSSEEDLDICKNAIVVDNASTDDTVSLIEQRFPGVTLISLPDNAGFGAANNVGIEKALDDGADYILLLNQDAKVAPACVRLLVNYCENTPDTGLAVPVHLSYDGSELERRFCNYLWESAPVVFSDAFLGALKSSYPINGAPAAIWLLRREALLDAGGFDPTYFLYGEDDDLAFRLRNRNWDVRLVPEARAFHYVTRHDNPLANQSRLQRLFKARIISSLKTAPTVSRGLLRIVYLVTSETIKALLSFNLKTLVLLAKSTLWAMVKLFGIIRARKISLEEKSPFLRTDDAISKRGSSSA